MNPNELLAHVKIASPCPARWDSMRGNNRVRFCSQCQRNVYNLSAMSAGESAHLIRATEGRLCARFYRREDGTILVVNCPVGAARGWGKVKSVLAAATVTILGTTGMIGIGQWIPGAREWLKKHPPAMRTCSPLMGEMVMGKMTVPPAPVPPSTSNQLQEIKRQQGPEASL